MEIAHVNRSGRYVDPPQSAQPAVCRLSAGRQRVQHLRAFALGISAFSSHVRPLTLGQLTGIANQASSSSSFFRLIGSWQASYFYFTATYWACVCMWSGTVAGQQLQKPFTKHYRLNVHLRAFSDAFGLILWSSLADEFVSLCSVAVKIRCSWLDVPPDFHRLLSFQLQIIEQRDYDD